jgi:hypothetical protein
MRAFTLHIIFTGSRMVRKYSSRTVAFVWIGIPEHSRCSGRSGILLNPCSARSGIAKPVCEHAYAYIVRYGSHLCVQQSLLPKLPSSL